ncbi:MAG: DMT family transporter [Cyclobacteriaceae bacterium]|nr:DMT family transporter [Cyclobacteriaceae bacterium]
MWILLGIVSAVLLGLYDVAKKWSLNGNAVIPVLLLATLSGFLVFAPLMLLSSFFPDWSVGKIWYIAPQTPYVHFLFFVKSLIVGSSWMLAYFAMKHLPITITTPIRASSPVFTVFGALLILGERFSVWQWIGVATIVISYYLFMLTGKKEGIYFRNNKWIWMMFAAALIGAGSSIYDKFLVQRFDRLAMQAWFSCYLVLIYLVIFLTIWWPGRRKYTIFQWRPSIIMIGLLLVAADFVYFYALTYPEALIGLLSPIRRSSVAVSFLFGGLLFKDKNLGNKGFILLGILAGILLIYLVSE